jgi:hypothetical protein
MERITAELREYFGDCYLFRYGDVRERLTAIADRIDEQYDRTCRALDSAWSATTHEVLEQTIDELSDEWVKLPVDADGEVVRIGDVMVMASHPFGCEDKPLVVDRMELSRGMHGEVWCLALDTDRSCWTRAAVLRHYQPPTVEDVLRQFLGECESASMLGYTDTPQDIFDTYVAKLQLKEDE